MTTPCYCIALRKAARRVSSFYDEALAPTGISIAQFSLLKNIERRNSVSLTELGKLLELDRSTVGRNIKVLARAGLVEAAPGADDQREATVSLTEPGTAALRKSEPLWAKAQKRIESQLGTKGSEKLVAALSTL